MRAGEVSILGSGSTAVTQAQGDNSTKIATTAYVDAKTSSLDAFQNMRHFEEWVNQTYGGAITNKNTPGALLWFGTPDVWTKTTCAVSGDGLEATFIADQSSETGATSYRVGDGGKKMAQSFQVQEDLRMMSISVNLAAKTGSPTNLVLRIETDNAGVPSGSLVDAYTTATIATPTTGWNEFGVAQAVAAGTNYNHVFTKNTTYWIVLSATGAAGTYVNWIGDAATAAYAYGNAATYVSSWTANATIDMQFRFNRPGTLTFLPNSSNHQHTFKNTDGATEIVPRFAELLVVATLYDTHTETTATLSDFVLSISRDDGTTWSTADTISRLFQVSRTFSARDIILSTGVIDLSAQPSGSAVDFKVQYTGKVYYKVGRYIAIYYRE